MPKEILVVLTIVVLPLTLFLWAASVDIGEFKGECSSHGGISVISRDTSVCYAPGTIIDVGVKGE